MLLDLDEPRRVHRRAARTAARARGDEREGYVPNVVYSCGALLHGGHLVLPYGLSDAAIGVAVISVPELLAELQRPASR